MSMFIDVEKPATVTLPVKTQDVLIVNNALPQPVGYGLNAPSDKKSVSDSIAKRLRLAPWQVVTAAYQYMDNAKFFSDVSFYKKPLRKDRDWLVVDPLSEKVRNDFFENENFDLLISIDRLLFNSTNESNKLEIGKMTSILTFSAYLRDKAEPVIQTTIEDSVKTYYPEVYFDGGVPYLNYEELVTEMIQHSSVRLGEKLGDYFAPSWDTAERIYFVRNLSDATKMSDYLNQAKWIEAISDWTGAFDKAKKSVDKAKLATNIALAYEMKDEFNKAGEWAKEAKAFFQDASENKYSKEISYLEEYIKALQEREKNNIKLNEQYGVEKR
ncbi:hypothetical protein FACS1894145_3170 [Bacteroidia bacterium]|nr:hypothetical protein FACS1894145_3170 [Bacteroidia bacterium]